MKFLKYTYLAAGFCMMMTSCSEFTPTGYTEEPSLPQATSMDYNIGGEAKHDVNITWTLPADKDVTGCVLYRNAQEIETFGLNADRQYSYNVLGTPLGEEVVYTVKVLYNNGSISTGKSVVINLPTETFAGVSNLKSEVDGRTVTLSWNLPSQSYRTGIRIITDGNEAEAKVIEADATSVVLKAQPMETTLTYSVEAIYDTYYYSPAESVQQTIGYVAPKMLFLLPEDCASYADLQDDDELAAASWFANLEDAEFVHPSEIGNYDASTYAVMWIMVDRVGLPMGWENLPGGFAAPSTIAALQKYSNEGGSLYLSNMATQLTVPLNVVPENMAPTIFGNGDGGFGDDVWVINPYLGWDFKDGADQGFYDRTNHAVFAGLTLEDPNSYGYENLPLIGPGQREDHNCMWDCNIYGRGSERDVIRNFEVNTNSLVLATWGHVRDHCVAGMVDFFKGPNHGHVLANGLAAYEWNQNTGVNPYQGNVEKLTENILNYLKK
ncbi:MAG: DUF4960 domain-containing protein [Muribaculaceae bacterium]|nr:DUF4960 domain-containing protein [Muribaculaceae bacterium]